jgi:hypothetical protein
MLASVDAQKLARNGRCIQEISKRCSDVFGVRSALQNCGIALFGEMFLGLPATAQSRARTGDWDGWAGHFMVTLRKTSKVFTAAP